MLVGLFGVLRKMLDISTPVPKIEDPQGICHHLANFFRNKVFLSNFLLDKSEIQAMLTK